MTRLVGVRVVCDGCRSAAALVFCVGVRRALCAACSRGQSPNGRVDLERAITAIPFCERCDAAPAVIYCSTENTTLCLRCDATLHQSKAERRHERSDICEAMAQRTFTFTGSPPGNSVLRVAQSARGKHEEKRAGESDGEMAPAAVGSARQEQQPSPGRFVMATEMCGNLEGAQAVQRIEESVNDGQAAPERAGDGTSMDCNDIEGRLTPGVERDTPNDSTSFAQSDADMLCAEWLTNATCGASGLGSSVADRVMQSEKLSQIMAAAVARSRHVRSLSGPDRESCMLAPCTGSGTPSPPTDPPSTNESDDIEASDAIETTRDSEEPAAANGTPLGSLSPSVDENSRRNPRRRPPRRRSLLAPNQNPNTGGGNGRAGSPNGSDQSGQGHSSRPGSACGSANGSAGGAGGASSSGTGSLAGSGSVSGSGNFSGSANASRSSRRSSAVPGASASGAITAVAAAAAAAAGELYLLSNAVSMDAAQSGQPPDSHCADELAAVASAAADAAAAAATAAREPSARRGAVGPTKRGNVSKRQASSLPRLPRPQLAGTGRPRSMAQRQPQRQRPVALQTRPLGTEFLARQDLEATSGPVAVAGAMAVQTRARQGHMQPTSLRCGSVESRDGVDARESSSADVSGVGTVPLSSSGCTRPGSDGLSSRRSTAGTTTADDLSAAPAERAGSASGKPGNSSEDIEIPRDFNAFGSLDLSEFDPAPAATLDLGGLGLVADGTLKRRRVEQGGRTSTSRGDSKDDDLAALGGMGGLGEN